MNIVFESPRLYFRTFTDADAELLYELNSNPNVLKYLHEPPTSREEIISTLQDKILPQYKLHGYGRWAVHLKSNNAFIGSCGLKYLSQTEETDLGYRYKEEYWNKGYATEAAKAVIVYGFNVLGLEQIFARALPQNTASFKVMEKCGMHYAEDVDDDYGLTIRKYVIVNGE